MNTLQQGDDEAAAVAVAPRVTLKDMEARIAERHDFTAAEMVRDRKASGVADGSPLEVLSICILRLNNGWTLVGTSAPASAANFNAELGRNLAYEDCIRQLWPLEGYLLRQHLHETETPDLLETPF